LWIDTIQDMSTPPSPAERQRRLAATLAALPSWQERLEALLAHGRLAPPLPPGERSDERLVPGCVSPVWLEVVRAGDRLQLRCAAGAPALQGLIGTVVRLCDGALCVEIAAFEFTLLAELGLERQLSLTRREAVARTLAAIRAGATAVEPT
jgi:cysteine desulfuration protein SufE